MVEKNEEVKAEKKEKKEKKSRPMAELDPRYMRFHCVLDCEALGTWPQNPDIFIEHIVKKSGADIDKDKLEAEIASMPIDELVEKGETVFGRDDDGNPILWDYQFKGFIKECFRTMVEFGDIKLGSYKASKWTIDRVIDNFVFVYPREIKLNIPEGKQLGKCTRPLRAKTMKGDRVALACSEEVPRGTSFDVKLEYLNPALEPYLTKIMTEMCKRKGIGQWRNSGKGRFTATPVEK